MKKIISTIIVLTLLCVLPVCSLSASSESQETGFSVEFYNHGDGTLDMEVLTNKTEGVGGIRITVSFDENLWTVDEDLTASIIKNGDVVVVGNEIRFLWESIGDTTLSNKLFRTTFHSAQSSIDVSTIQVKVLEYYDNTVQMNDLPYEIVNYSVAEGEAEPLYSVWGIILTMLLILIGVALLFAVSIKWRYYAKTLFEPLFKKIYGKIKKTAS